MSQFISNMTNEAISNKVVSYAGIIHLDGADAMTGAAWNFLGMLISELESGRCGDEVSGRYDARRALVNARKVQEMKPIHFGA
jgi:hypothetical protein